MSEGRAKRGRSTHTVTAFMCAERLGSAVYWHTFQTALKRGEYQVWSLDYAAVSWHCLDGSASGLPLRPFIPKPIHSSRTCLKSIRLRSRMTKDDLEADESSMSETGDTPAPLPCKVIAILSVASLALVGQMAMNDVASSPDPTVANGPDSTPGDPPRDIRYSGSQGVLGDNTCANDPGESLIIVVSA